MQIADYTSYNYSECDTRANKHNHSPLVVVAVLAPGRVIIPNDRSADT